MKKVLIIGANSYIGQKFHEYINLFHSQNIETSLVSASNGSWRSLDFTMYDVVLHLSAIVHKKERKDMKELYNKVNHRLAVDIAIKAKNSGIKQFIFMSTAAIYGRTTGGISKETIPTPTTYYGMSKLAAERDIGELQEESFKVAIIRPPMVYGDGCRGNYAKLKQAAKYLFLFPNYHNKRSVINIKKLNEFIADIVLNNLTGIYLPQDDEFFDTCRMVIEERNAMGKKTILFPGFLITLLLGRITILDKIFGDFYYYDK
jgi:UDP-glucose 4-epimerase